MTASVAEIQRFRDALAKVKSSDKTEGSDRLSKWYTESIADLEIKRDARELSQKWYDQ